MIKNLFIIIAEWDLTAYIRALLYACMFWIVTIGIGMRMPGSWPGLLIGLLAMAAGAAAAFGLMVVYAYLSWRARQR